MTLPILKHPTPRRKSPRSKPLVLSRRLCLWHTASASPYCLRQYGLWNRPIATAIRAAWAVLSGPYARYAPPFFCSIQPAKPSPLTKKLHQNPTSPPAPLPWGEGSMLHKKQKALAKPRPHPRPLSHGERGACFIKNKKPSPKPKPTKGSGKTQKAHTQTHKRLRQNTKSQASPPHELRKGRAASPRGPFAIRGAWGDFVPPQKKL